MLLFKDIKQNYPVYILDTQEFSLIQGKATQVSFPRLEMNQKTGKTEMVVDVTIEANGKMATYAIPESHSVTYAGHLVLSIEKSGLSIPGKVTTGDVTYAANMAYADFYPDPLKDEAACLRYAHKVANDPDGYDGMIFCRWTADAIGKSNQVGLGKIRIVC